MCSAGTVGDDAGRVGLSILQSLSQPRMMSKTSGSMSKKNLYSPLNLNKNIISNTLLGFDISKNNKK